MGCTSINIIQIISFLQIIISFLFQVNAFSTCIFECKRNGKIFGAVDGTCRGSSGECFNAALAPADQFLETCGFPSNPNPFPRPENELIFVGLDFPGTNIAPCNAFVKDVLAPLAVSNTIFVNQQAITQDAGSDLSEAQCGCESLMTDMINGFSGINPISSESELCTRGLEQVLKLRAGPICNTRRTAKGGEKNDTTVQSLGKISGRLCDFAISKTATMLDLGWNPVCVQMLNLAKNIPGFDISFFFDAQKAVDFAPIIASKICGALSCRETNSQGCNGRSLIAGACLILNATEELGCFPEDAIVHTRAGKKFMRDLLPGMEVLVDENRFEPILIMAESNHDASISELFNYQLIRTKSGAEISLTPSHHLISFVGTEKNETLVVLPSKSITHEHKLKVLNARNELIVESVISNEGIEKYGRLSPVTFSFQIIVDDVLASCGSEETMQKSMAQVLLVPFAILQQILPANIYRALIMHIITPIVAIVDTILISAFSKDWRIYSPTAYCISLACIYCSFAIFIYACCEMWKILWGLRCKLTYQ